MFNVSHYILSNTLYSLSFELKCFEGVDPVFRSLCFKSCCLLTNSQIKSLNLLIGENTLIVNAHRLVQLQSVPYAFLSVIFGTFGQCIKQYKSIFHQKDFILFKFSKELASFLFHSSMFDNFFFLNLFYFEASFLFAFFSWSQSFYYGNWS